MTLRKCTVTQLDDTFWRVDWDGRAAEAKTANCTLSARPPAVAERDGESWFFAGIWSQSLDDALSRFDLTRHSPAADPETAEEVLRANARIHPGYGDAHVVSGFTRDHAREILAELDRARENVSALKASLAENGLTRHDPKEETAEERLRAACAEFGEREGGVADVKDIRAILAELDRVRAEPTAEQRKVAGAYCKIASEVMRLAFDHQEPADCFCGNNERNARPVWTFRHSDKVIDFVRDAVRAKIDGAAQRPVDVEAVLAPFRSAKRTIEAERKKYGASAKESTEDGSYRFGAEDAYAAWAHWVAEQALAEALAEAEKIGRGE